MSTSAEAIPSSFDDSICDSGFRSRFRDVPKILAAWVGQERLQNADILDFGCGEGICALGLALRNPRARVVGVDIMPDPERCLGVARVHLGLQELPRNLALHRVQRGSLHDLGARFDMVYSWSVFEHVDQIVIDDTLRLIRTSLRPHGIFLAQIAPLYYSSEGFHLFHKIPVPWAHLSTQHSLLYEQLAAAVADADERAALWSTYRTLNKLTADDLIRRIKDAGFKVVREYRTRDKRPPSPALLSIYNKEILTTNQVVILAEVS